MAKGEGGEQYSNASLLNKPVSSDGIKLARKVGSFISLFQNSGLASVSCLDRFSRWHKTRETVVFEIPWASERKEHTGKLTFERSESRNVSKARGAHCGISSQELTDITSHYDSIKYLMNENFIKW